MQMIELSKLKEHPRNNEFFDDITNEKWIDFLESIKRRGIIEPIVITKENIFSEYFITVSGHQRVRAGKELGFLEIPCRVVNYPEEDERLHIKRSDMILEDLISTNIMQRGIGNINPMKMTKCIIELERLYGIKKGNNGGSNQYCKKDNKQLYTQKDLANQLGISEDTLQNYKKLNSLIPELQSLILDNSLKATTAYKIWVKLLKEEQTEIINKIGRDKIKKLTQKQTEEEINKIKNINSKIVKNRKPIPQTTLKHLINKTNGKCEICNWGGLGLEGILIPHHIHKYADTEDNSINNLVLICPNCHNIIHTLEHCNDKEIIDIIKSNINKDDLGKMEYYLKELNEIK